MAAANRSSCESERADMSYEPEIKPAMSNEELQTAINVIVSAKVPELFNQLRELVSEQARRAKLWTAKEAK